MECSWGLGECKGLCNGERERERERYIYIHMYVYLHVYVCVYSVYIDIYIGIRRHLCTGTCVDIRLYIHVHVRIHITAQTYKHVGRTMGNETRAGCNSVLRLGTVCLAHKLSNSSSHTPCVSLSILRRNLKCKPLDPSAAFT